MDKDNYEGIYGDAFAKRWEALSELDPRKVCETALCDYDESRNCLAVTSFNHKLDVFRSEKKIFFENTQESPPIMWALGVLNYLITAKDMEIEGEWVSYRILPYGNVYYPSIENQVFKGLSKHFSEYDKELLLQGLEKLGCNSIDGKADIVTQGFFAPRVPVLIQFWYGEEDIPASLKILFDSSVCKHMHMEDIAIICTVFKYLMLKKT